MDQENAHIHTNTHTHTQKKSNIIQLFRIRKSCICNSMDELEGVMLNETNWTEIEKSKLFTYGIAMKESHL